MFGYAKPGTVVVTTPNREYNAVWESLDAGSMRHGDHRFEWSRDEFREWAEGVAGCRGYGVEFKGVGLEHAEFGTPTQMAVFGRIT